MEAGLDVHYGFGLADPAHMGSGLHFQGLLDEIRIWNIARDAGDILRDMTQPLTGTEPGLVCYFRLDEGLGGLTGDATGSGSPGHLLNQPVWVDSTAPLSRLRPITRRADGQLELEFRAVPSTAYELQSAADLVHWATIQTNTAGVWGLLRFVDRRAAPRLAASTGRVRREFNRTPAPSGHGPAPRPGKRCRLTSQASIAGFLRCTTSAWGQATLPTPSMRRFGDNLALVEVDGAGGAGGGVRVVGDHDDGLAMIPAQRFEQRQDLVSRLAVEIPGGFVRQDQGRVRDERAGDAHALLFAARELPRMMAQAVGKANRGEGQADLTPATGGAQMGQQQRQLDVPLGGQGGEEVVELEDESHVSGAPPGKVALAPVGQCGVRPPR